MECDEHVCRNSMHLPCGDGQCGMYYKMLETLISSLPDVSATTFTCHTLRDLAFQCELHEPVPLWTLADGFCIFIPAEWGHTTNKTIQSQCEFLLKCQLSRNMSTLCATNDSLLLHNECKSNLEHIQYPVGSLPGPRINSFYRTDSQLTNDLLPHFLIINGHVRCAGFHLTINH